MSELRENLKDTILEIRQYLLNTEFAPMPFTEPLDVKKLKDGFADQILSEVRAEIEKCELTDGEIDKAEARGIYKATEPFHITAGGKSVAQVMKEKILEALK